MRLTLRTLLAWLDGVAPSGETEDLARKIAGSTAAGTVIDRIQAVVASPAIDASRADARGLGGDANAVAEYLTNALPVDTVATFERVCIESDSHLAEVAACHRILAEVAASPSILEEAPADLVARLCAQVGARVGATTALGDAGDGEEDAELVSVGSQSVPTTRPLPADGSRSLAYVAVVAAVGLVVLLGAGLGWSLWRSAAEGDPRATAARPAARPAETRTRPTETHKVEPPIIGPGVEAVSEVAVNEPPKDVQQPVTNIAAPPPRDEPSLDRPPVTREAPAPEGPPPQVDTPPPPRAQASAPPAVERVPGGEALAIAAVPVRVAPPPAPEPPMPADEPSDRTMARPGGDGKASDPSPAFAVGPSPLFIRRVAAAAAEPRGTPSEPAEWGAVAAGQGFVDRQDLIVPPGFSPTLAIGSATLRADGATRIVVSPHPQDPEGSPGSVEVVFGRIMVTGVDPATPIGILAGGLAGRVSGDGGAPVLIEVRLSREPGKAGGGDAISVRSIVSFPQGGTWLPDEPSSPSPEGLAGDGVVPAGAAVVFDGLQGASGIASGHARLERGPSTTVRFASRASGELLTRTSCEALAAAAATERPLAEAIESLLADGRMENRAAAAATLALLGDYRPLVQVLAADEPGRRLPGTQWEALARSMVPLALSRGARSAELFRMAVEQELPGEAGEIVLRLVEGLSDRDLADGGDGMLVRSLEHPSLVVRRFAAAMVFEIVRPSDGDRLRFRPDAAGPARAEGVKWWRIQLEKGLIRRTPAEGLSKAADE